MSTLIFDRRKVLGEGDYGTVFEGKWRGIPGAVKRVPHQCLNSGNERELKALQSLNHPNVIKLLHTESVEYFRFYVLELCEASLDQLFLKDDDPRKYRGPMPVEIEVLHQLSIGLEYIHQMKLIHRNIKPEHFLIWVNPVNKEVVMKWSGFESITEANERGTCSMSGIRGTSSWLAPEILKLLDDGEANETKVKQRGTIKSDVFAEGLVFGYFLLKGLHLFGSRMQIKTNIINNESVNLFKIQMKKVRDLITKMLKKNPGDRISSSDVVKQLKQILEKEKINHLGPQPSCVTTQSSNEIKLDKDKILGRGDYGKIFRGEWNNKLVAVKLIKLNKVKQYNKEEELILKRLDHPNVVKFLHIENDSEYRYYALELCCASLDQIFLKNGDHTKYFELMPPAKDFFYQLAIGLDYIHKTGLIHQDIKPQNVLIWTDSTTKEVLIKWTGFGLSRVDEKIKNNSSVFDWLAPELLMLLDKGEFDMLPTVKSDVFAQGLVFGYYLLKGEHLFGSPVKAASNIMANEPVNLQKIKKYAISDLIKKMLEPNPEKRMTSSDVAKELEQIRAKGRQYHYAISMADDNTPSLKQIKVDVNKILGTGGYGIVFQGEWNNNQVAVKQIPLSKVESNQREEEALQMLNHPNIIKLFHAESGSENRYYAIELCAASLDKLFFSDESAKKYRGPMPSQIDVLLQLATGLEYIHEKKVIHRDITPKNILIWVNPENTKQVLLKWADFGLSKQIGKSETYTVSKVRGAEGWFAPEILKILDDEETSLSEAKQRGTIKSDVFNEGLVFGYYLLKGRHLFGALAESNIYHNKPVNLEKIQWEIGRELIKKMIHPNPKKRISSSDVTQELRQMKFGSP